MFWTIRRKLFAGFGLTAALLILCIGIARWSQVREQTTQTQIVRTMDMLRDVEHLVAYINEVTSAQRAYLISGDPSMTAGIPEMRKDGRATIDKVQAEIAGDEAQKERFSQVISLIQQRIKVVDSLNTARHDQGFEGAEKIFATGEDNRLLAAIIVQIGAMRTAAQEQLQELQAGNSRLQNKIIWTEVIMLVLALIMMLVIAQTLVRSITQNVSITVGLMSAMANRDLSVADGESASSDELAEAIAATNTMKAAMTEALSEVAQAASQVASAGAEIELTAKQMAGTTHEEQHNIEQFASSLAEMNAAVREVAEHAAHASGSATEAVDSAMNGQQRVKLTHETMNKILDSVTDASNNIQQLGEETKNIGIVVGMIQEIAEQTNLLALNAAIEAARAGEHGKGFAVVAQEVRQLAERTASFTKEISGKVASVQDGAVRAVESMQQGEAVVQDGVARFQEVIESLAVILQRIEGAQQGIAMIATSTTQQSSATEGLNKNIHQISSEIALTAKSVDQTVEACAELARLASSMQEIVQTFRLPNKSHPQKRFDKYPIAA
jgi:methyl-accepting chemotaxis protein